MCDSYKIAGGRRIEVNYKEFGKDFGEFNPVNSKITIYKKVFDDTEYVPQDVEDIKRTLFHEIIHSFQYYLNTEMDETQAQVFSNFLYEAWPDLVKILQKVSE